MPQDDAVGISDPAEEAAAAVRHRRPPAITLRLRRHVTFSSCFTERNRRRAVASWRHLMASVVDLIVAAFSEAPPTAQGVSAMMHNDCT
jgi:hypothetical protein